MKNENSKQYPRPVIQFPGYEGSGRFRMINSDEDVREAGRKAFDRLRQGFAESSSGNKHAN